MIFGIVQTRRETTSTLWYETSAVVNASTVHKGCSHVSQSGREGHHWTCDQVNWGISRTLEFVEQRPRRLSSVRLIRNPRNRRTQLDWRAEPTNDHSRNLEPTGFALSSTQFSTSNYRLSFHCMTLHFNPMKHWIENFCPIHSMAVRGNLIRVIKCFAMYVGSPNHLSFGLRTLWFIRKC